MPAYCRAAIKKITVEEFVFGVKVVLGERLLVGLEIFNRNGLSGNPIKCIVGGYGRIFVEGANGP